MLSVLDRSIHFMDCSNHFLSVNDITNTVNDETRCKEIIGLIKAGKTDAEIIHGNRIIHI